MDLLLACLLIAFGFGLFVRMLWHDGHGPVRRKPTIVHGRLHEGKMRQDHET